MSILNGKFTAADDSIFYYKNDSLHREDGPAIEWSDGDKSWYYQGKRINCNSQEEFIRMIKIIVFL